MAGTTGETAACARTDGFRAATGPAWPGAGYIYNGEKPLYVTIPMVAGAVALTQVRRCKRLLDHDPTAFGVLIGAVFVINTALAIDVYREAAVTCDRPARPGTP